MYSWVTDLGDAMYKNADYRVWCRENLVNK